jgi:hypothetical protein
MTEILRILSDHFQDSQDIVEFEFLSTEKRSYDAPIVAMSSSLKGFLPVPRNLNRISRWAESTNMSKGSILLSLSNIKGSELRGGGQAFAHHNKMRLIGSAPKESFQKVGKRLLSKSDRLVALSSKVKLVDKSVGNLIFLDFACKNDKTGRKNAITVIRQLGLRGVLVDSGRSFHFYSSAHFSFEDWARKMGEALLFSPITDGAWIAHQLIEGRSALRISKKAGGELTLVANI